MPNLGTINKEVIEDFSVISSVGSPVTGLVDGDFSKLLYNPDGSEVSNTIITTIEELGNGDYRAIFTPNIIGTWYLKLIHDIYFPHGKGGEIQVYKADFNTLVDTEQIYK
jgi:hypothetical protein